MPTARGVKEIKIYFLNNFRIFKKKKIVKTNVSKPWKFEKEKKKEEKE